MQLLLHYQNLLLTKISSYLFSHCHLLLAAVLFIYFLAVNQNSGKHNFVLSKSFSRHLLLAMVSLSISSNLLSSILLSVLVPYQLSNQKLFITPQKGISKLDVPLLGNTVPLCRQVTSGHCSTRLLPKNYLTVHKRVIRPKHSCEYRAPDRPSFLCLASTSP